MIDLTEGVPSNFGFANFNFKDPEEYACSLGTGKLKGTDRKLTKSGTRICLVQMINGSINSKNLLPDEMIPIPEIIKWKRSKRKSPQCGACSPQTTSVVKQSLF